jgi:hypothetical protein
MRKWRGKTQEEHARAVRARGASSEWGSRSRAQSAAEDTEDEAPCANLCVAYQHACVESIGISTAGLVCWH